MGGLNNKSNIKDNKNCFENENNLLNSDNNNYGNIIFIPLILDQIIQFLDDYDKKNLYLCNKKFYQLYCNQIIELIIYDKVNKSKVKKTLNKYKNVESLKIVDCNDISFLDENCNIIIPMIMPLNKNLIFFKIYSQNIYLLNYIFKFDFPLILKN